MSKIKNDIPVEDRDKEFLLMLKEINEEMIMAPIHTRLPNYIELGIRLADRLQRPKPYSDKTICFLMDYYNLYSNRSGKCFEKRKTPPTDMYIQSPSLVYIHKTCDTSFDSVVSWCKRNLEDYFVDAIQTSEGILLIGSDDRFPAVFTKKYDKAAKEQGTKFKIEKPK